MSKYKYKITSLAVFFLVLSLSLTACLNIEKPPQLKELQSQNQALQEEVASLKAALVSQEPEVSQTVTSPKPSEQTSQTNKPSASSPEGDFVYQGDLVVNGKRVAEMSREEMEALPTMATPITDLETGETTLVYPPDTIKNLYQQLEYVDKINRYMSGEGQAAQKPESEPEPGSYDIRDKGILAYRWPEDKMSSLYELDQGQVKKLQAWVEAHLSETTAKEVENFSYDTQILAPEVHLFLTKEDFLTKQNKRYAEIMNEQGQLFEIAISSEAGLQLRDLLASYLQEPIYDQADQLTLAGQKLPKLSLNLDASMATDGQVISFRVQNEQDNTWTFRNFYKLFFYDGEEWQQLSPSLAGECYESREDLVLAGESRSLTIDYASCYGKLPQGYYRMDIGMDPQQTADGAASQYKNRDRENYPIYFVIR